MEFDSKSSDVLTQKTDCAVVPVFEKGKLSTIAKAVDTASGGMVQELIKAGDISGKTASTVMLHNVPDCTAKRVLLVGFGSAKNSNDRDFRKAITTAANAIKATGAKTAHLFLQDVNVKGRDEAWKALQSGLVFGDRLYQVNSLKSKTALDNKLRSITYCCDSKKDLSTCRAASSQALAISIGSAVCKDLGNLPANVCTPTYLADQAKQMARGDAKLTARILSEKQMADLKMGSLLSVTAGTKEPAKLIVLEYKGGSKTQKPLVLVGKGITFDTGGISLKPGGQMDEMKFDMCGAASVLGTMKAIQRLKPKTNVVAIIAAAENMPSGRATKPGDIVTSMAGKTIEVLNTDAEGRLVLCDALTYAERYKPRAVIDVATLTGAVIVALGSHATGLYSNQEDLAQQLLDSGEYTGDPAWQMPLWDEYKQQLRSNFADLANIGGREAGSVTAACFLSHFTEKYPWAHLDIAGTAWLHGANKGGTGRPVPLLVHYILNNG